MSTQRGTKHGHHDAEPDPQLESKLTPEQTQALEARVKALPFDTPFGTGQRGQPIGTGTGRDF